MIGRDGAGLSYRAALPENDGHDRRGLCLSATGALVTLEIQVCHG